jgi:hypothetical protein
VASEAVLNVETGPNGAYVRLGGEKAMILRSDITLENGVMHVSRVATPSGMAALTETLRRSSTRCWPIRR